MYLLHEAPYDLFGYGAPFLRAVAKLEPELVEIGYFIATTMGQQRWLRTLNIDHHEVLAGSDGSMAPGFETAEAAAKSKADPNYWAKRKVESQAAAE